MLLIISNKDDLTVDYLINYMRQKEVPYFRLNSDELGSAEYHFEIKPDEIIRKISIGGNIVSLEDISSVWYRRIISPNVSDNIIKEQEYFIKNEIRHLTEGLVIDPNILWVNPIDAVTIAERKVYQLRLAQKIGFTIPKTLISNKPDDILKFVNNSEKGAICKPIFHGLFVTPLKNYSVYTRSVIASEIDAHLEHLSVCPSFFQERIPKGHDLRITYIGDKVFPVKILGKTRPYLDWRHHADDVKYEICDLDPKLDKLCRDFMKLLNILYGAFDFVKTDDGQVYFLEVNPTGEWVWLENELGLPMKDAFLELFNVKASM